MGIVSILAIFGIVWWTVLFAVLPLGVRSQLEDGHVEAGTDPGAPVRHGLVFKALLTTAISLVVTAVVVLVIETRAITLDDVPIFRTP